MLDETRSKPIQHENCVEWAWKYCIKWETNGPVLLHRNIHFTETPHIYICILNFHTPLPCNSSLKGGFPSDQMNADFAAKFIWACAFSFVYSLAGKIFLLKIVKFATRKVVTTVRPIKTQIFNFVIKYISIRSNRKWLLMIWALSTYLQMLFQL